MRDERISSPHPRKRSTGLGRIFGQRLVGPEFAMQGATQPEPRFIPLQKRYTVVAEAICTGVNLSLDFVFWRLISIQNAASRRNVRLPFGPLIKCLYKISNFLLQRRICLRERLILCNEALIVRNQRRIAGRALSAFPNLAPRGLNPSPYRGEIPCSGDDGACNSHDSHNPAPNFSNTHQNPPVVEKGVVGTSDSTACGDRGA